MIKIETNNLHWVMCRKGNGIDFCLANVYNEQLKCPILRDLTEKDMEALTQSRIDCESYDDFYSYTYCLPKKVEILVTAPLYIKTDFDYIETTGVYTDISINPREFQRINELVQKIIPSEKIHKSGCYVNLGI